MTKKGEISLKLSIIIPKAVSDEVMDANVNLCIVFNCSKNLRPQTNIRGEKRMTQSLNGLVSEERIRC